MKFFIGLHQPSDAQHFKRCFISVSRLKDRKSDFIVDEWIMDSGAFSQIYNKGEHMPVKQYADYIKRWSKCGKMLAAVSQDYMCEPFILDKTGMTVKEHQALTIERYLKLCDLVDNAYIMPVLQGYKADDYVKHLKMYGDLLKPGMWVGLGSVCKRNTKPLQVLDILYEIRKERKDLKLHGFGLKITALKNETIRRWLYSADSMAWSFQARKQGRNANDWREAKSFINKINSNKQDMYQISIYDVILR